MSWRRQIERYPVPAGRHFEEECIERQDLSRRSEWINSIVSPPGQHYWSFAIVFVVIEQSGRVLAHILMRSIGSCPFSSVPMSDSSRTDGEV